MPVPKPTTPKNNISHGRVCSQRSSKYPMPPPTSMAMTRTKGSSVALADWRFHFWSWPVPGSEFGGGDGFSVAKGAKREEQ